MSARSPWLQRLRELLATGPLPREEAVNAVMPLVPPGRAFRFTARKLERTRAGRTPYAHRRERTPGDAQSVDAGARLIVGQSVWQEVKHGRLVQYEQEGVRWLRLP